MNKMGPYSGQPEMKIYHDSNRQELLTPTPNYLNLHCEASTSCSGGPPIDFGYTEPEPIPDKRCQYCGVRFLPKERFCIGCGAPT